MTQSDFEIFIHKLTSNSKKMPLMDDIDEAVKSTYFVKQCDILTKHICSKLKEKPKKWFKIYKALLLSEVCFAQGSLRCVRNLKANLISYQELKYFDYKKEWIDYGQKVRDYSEKLVQIIEKTNLGDYRDCIAQKEPKDHKVKQNTLKSKSVIDKEGKI